MWIDIDSDYLNERQERIIKELAMNFEEEAFTMQMLQKQIDNLSEQIKELEGNNGKTDA